jgi:hypothetical protein
MALAKMQALWHSRMNFRFGCKIEVRKMSQKLRAENGPSKKMWPNSSMQFKENRVWYWMP